MRLKIFVYFFIIKIIIFNVVSNILFYNILIYYIAFILLDKNIFYLI